MTQQQDPDNRRIGEAVSESESDEYNPEIFQQGLYIVGD